MVKPSNSFTQGSALVQLHRLLVFIGSIYAKMSEFSSSRAHSAPARIQEDDVLWHEELEWALCSLMPPQLLLISIQQTLIPGTSHAWQISRGKLISSEAAPRRIMDCCTWDLCISPRLGGSIDLLRNPSPITGIPSWMMASWRRLLKPHLMEESPVSSFQEWSSLPESLLGSVWQCL